MIAVETKKSNKELQQQLLALLQENKTFAEFPHLEEFVQRAKFAFYDQGSRVIMQGESGDRFYIVLSGQLRAIDIDQEPPRLLNYLSPGQFFGTRALLENGNRTATVEALLDAYVAEFDQDTWDWLLLTNDRLVRYFKNLEEQYEQHAQLDFPGRQWDEIVVVKTKRDVLFFLSKLTWPLILLIAPILFLIAAELLDVTFLEIITKDLLIAVLFNAPFVLLAGLLILYHYLDWRNDDFIVTTKRVVHIERILFYGEQRDEAPLTRIQDVTVISFDLIEKFFDYYDIEIKTAGAGILRVEGIPRAAEIRDIIFELRRKALERVSAADVSALRRMIARHTNLENVLEEPAMAVAEEEAQIKTVHEHKFRGPRLLNYFIPRTKEIIIDQKEGTKIIWHKHYIVLLTAIFIPALFFGGALYLLLAAFFGLFPFRGVASGLVVGMFGLAALASWVWLMVKYDGWQRDLYIVTDSRIIDIDGTPFGIRGEQRREGSFDTIQNITYNIPNFFSQLLNIGDVIIETAGTEATFTFKKVFNPSAVQEEVFNRMVLFQQKQRQKARDATANQLVEMIAEYHRLLEKSGAIKPPQ